VTRAAYAHDAFVILDPGEDTRAPGGAITVALCGHWDHEPPCRWRRSVRPDEADHAAKLVAN
jgi:hypothetical protein